MQDWKKCGTVSVERTDGDSFGKVNEKFGVFLQQGGLNAMQQRFVGEVVDYLWANGEITLRDLMVKTPFRDVSIGDLFRDWLDVFRQLEDEIMRFEVEVV